MHAIEMAPSKGWKGSHATLTSIQVSSFVSSASSFALDPLTATLLLGGAMSSVLLIAGLFRSSILTSVDGRGEGVVVKGIRKRVEAAPKSSADERKENSKGLSGPGAKSRMNMCSASDHRRVE